MEESKTIDRKALVVSKVSEYVTEASTIGLTPGEWPRILELDGVKYIRSKFNKIELEGHIEFVNYCTVDHTSCITVFND